jgi:hypothetical protein
MKNPLFKNPQDPLSPREEAEITQELAEAYRQNEISEKQAAFKRIVENVKHQLQRISKENNQ